MTNLSPAALAVWEAFNSEEPGVFVDYGDCLATALRAAADQVVPEERKGCEHFTNEAIRLNRMGVRFALLNIAAELDNNATHK